MEEVDESLPTTAEGLTFAELPSFDDALAKAEAAENIDFSLPETQISTVCRVLESPDEDENRFSFEDVIPEGSPSPATGDSGAVR